MLFLPSFDPETSHNLAIHLASIWRDTQIGLISAFFVPTQETQNWGYLTCCCCCCETKSWGQFYFYAFCNLFSFSFFRPWKVMKIYSLPLFLYFFSILLWVKTNLECMSHNLFRAQLLFIQSMNHFRPKTSSCLFFDNDGFVRVI